MDAQTWKKMRHRTQYLAAFLEAAEGCIDRDIDETCYGSEALAMVRRAQEELVSLRRHLKSVKPTETAPQPA